MHLKNINEDYHYKQQYLSWKNQKTSDWEMIFSFFVEGQIIKYPTTRLENDWNYWKMQVKPSQEDAIIFLNKFQWKKIKGKVVIALKKIIMNEWPAMVIDYIPSAVSVLKMQTEGKRPLSLLVNRPCGEPIMHRSDIFDFLNHDLEHLYMFNFDLDLKKAQVNFFQKLQGALEAKTITFGENTEYNQALEYLLSDMNTHPIHGLKYLHAIIPTSEIEFWSKLGTSMGFSGHDLELFTRINEHDLTEDNIKYIANFFT